MKSLHLVTIRIDFIMSGKCFAHSFLLAYFSDGNSTLDIADGIIFHSPYCKLVQKSFARLLLNDFLRDKNPDFQGRYTGLEALR